ncbi:Myosin type-2 heavy chain 1 [Podochytrium sp. JEL0797]|nr:Myosin type-2 heavy chain 1 [Podochytrium sp. JEL0797]
MLDIYSPQVMKAFHGKRRQETIPHVFGIAEECYRAMLEGKDQSVIVSGESGAGKTQTTRYLMQYLALVDTAGSTVTEDAVLASSPILEAFGNAKTTRNDNSSRFGKFVQLFFSDAMAGNSTITGAKVRTYLLERSRLVTQPENERNYHIFYQLCAGAPAAEKKQLGLSSWESFDFLNQGAAGLIRGVDDATEFRLTQEALSVLGVSVSTQWQIFQICAALLHIGNIRITSVSESASGILETDPSLLKACDLLGVNPREFCRWVTQKQSVIRGETFLKAVKLERAVVARDSVAKVIYTKLFDWLVQMINHNLQMKASDKQQFIGILDIYGFEHFTTNSFEQFCINYANEKLQQEFNAHVFRLEQDLYVQEGIEWTRISFSDNLPCIQLIESKLGILSLLDEESRLQNGTDANFVTKLHSNFASHKSYAKPRFGNTGFIVNHYAVDVTYTASGFIEKNMDSVSDELRGVLGSTGNAFLKLLLGEAGGEKRVSVAAPGKHGGKVSAYSRQPTLGSMFKASLQDLMDTVRRTESHYIRCIKPNASKTPFEFQGAMVLSQLQACGVLETIKISNAGYPNKLSYHEFASRYCILVPSQHWDNRDKKSLTQQIVVSILMDKSKFQFGKTKVFFKTGQIAFFENRRKDRVRYLVVLVQKNARRGIERRRFLEARKVVVELQSLMRGCLAKRALETLKDSERERKMAEKRAEMVLLAVGVIQPAWRRFQRRQQAQRELELVITLQTAVRRSIAVKSCQALKASKTSRESKPKPARPAVETSPDEKFQLEAKLVSLSQDLNSKTLQVLDLESRVGEATTWKDKYKIATSQISALKEEIVVLKAERDMFKEERDRFAKILTDAINLGVSSPFDGFPFIANSSNGATTVTQFRLSGSAVKRTKSVGGGIGTSLPGSDTIVSTLKTENESLKRMVETLRNNPPESQEYNNVRRRTMRAKSIFENDIVADAERERKAKNRYSGLLSATPNSEKRNSIRISSLRRISMLKQSPSIFSMQCQVMDDVDGALESVMEAVELAKQDVMDKVSDAAPTMIPISISPTLIPAKFLLASGPSRDASTPASAQTASDLPLQQFAFGLTEYRATIQVGTPPKNYRVLFDTGSFTMWLYGATCPSPACKRASNTYDVKASSTGVNLMLPTVSQSYADGSGYNGSLVQDTVVASGYTVPNFEFTQVTSYISSDPSGVSISDNYQDGIVGMGFRPAVNGYSSTLIEQLVANGNLPYPQFSWYITADEKEGYATFGGYDMTLFANSSRVPVWVPMISNDDLIIAGKLSLPLTSVSVGSTTVDTFTSHASPLTGKSQGTTGAASWDTGTAASIVTATLVKAIGAQIPGSNLVQFSGSTDISYTVPCAARKEVGGGPPITLNFLGGSSLTITAKEYIEVDQNTDGNCYLALTGRAGGYRNGTYLIGNTFLKRYVNVFDMKKKWIGFALSVGRTSSAGDVVQGAMVTAGADMVMVSRSFVFSVVLLFLLV